MTANPSLAKGHALAGEPVTSAHIVVISDQAQGEDFLEIASQWVNAGVLEPAIWVPSGSLANHDDELSDFAGVILARGESPVVQHVSVLESLAREPHDHIIVSVISPSTETVPNPLWTKRVERLLTTLATARPHQRNLGAEVSKGTEIRVLNLIFPRADSGNPGLNAALLRSAVVDVENLVVNPEDRPTPISMDTIPQPGKPRWAAHVVSATATLSGLWSSMATSPVVPDANWISGNVRVVRTFARVVLTHPLVTQVTESTKDVLLGDACPVAVPGVQIHPEPLQPMSESQFANLAEHYSEWLIYASPLGYQPIEEFEPPSERKRGFLESLRNFASFSGDKLAALPRWATRRVLSAFNTGATKKIYGEDGLVAVDARHDLNLRTDDPKLIDAWDFVADQRESLNAVLSAPTEAPEESDDPTPWVQLHEGIALFAEGRSNSQQASLTSDHGTILVAGSLDDVIPHPDDEFTVDAECDALLGGDGVSRQVSWLDAEGAARLDTLLRTVIKRSRQRVEDLETSYLQTERDFFSSQERFLEARFDAEDAAAHASREALIAAADNVAAEAPPATPRSDQIDAERAGDVDPGTPDAGAAHIDVAWSRDPFESPLDDAVARPEDISGLWEATAETALKAQRERRLRGALSEVTAAERDRVDAAREELKLLQRTHTDLSRWVARRSSSFIGRVLRRIEAEGKRMNELEERVLATARASEPEFGSRSMELQRAYVSSVLKGLAVAALVAGILSAINLVTYFINRNQDSPVFTGIPWWVVALAFVVAAVLAVLLPLVSYFQAWTREKVRAEDAYAELVYQTRLVTHVRKERLRLARLHMQVPQRVRYLGLWWHYWDEAGAQQASRITPEVPGSENLPHHLQWAVSDWTHSTVFRRIRDDLLKSQVSVGYRSSLIERALRQYSGATGLGDALDPTELARMRSTEALDLVHEWIGDRRARLEATAELERGLAQEAQALNREAGQVSPRVQILNPDPIRGLVIQTDLLDDPYGDELNTNEFLLGISVDGAEMGYRVWGYGIGVQKFKSFFAGPERLRDSLAPTVTFVDVEASKVCSSEVAVRLDITDQVSAASLRCDAQEQGQDDSERDVGYSPEVAEVLSPSTLSG